jgi:predicted nucleic acid-binding protein
LNRPFDDQTYERIYFETQSFLILLKHIDDAKVQIINSFAIEYEISKIPDIERELKIREYLNSASEFIELVPEIEHRAVEVEKLGFSGIDAFHIAVAEYAKVDYFVTCDDDILKSAEKHSDKIKVKVISISKLIPEIIKDA